LGYTLNFLNTFPKRIANTYQGIKDINENINPIVPAVEGIIIKNPVTKPLNSISKCNDVVQKRENCDTTNILLPQRKGIHR